MLMNTFKISRMKEDIYFNHQDDFYKNEANDCNKLSEEWSKKDLYQLLKNMSSQLASNNKSKFSYTLRKLNWNQVKFNNFTEKDCICKWKELQSNLRTYRLLDELIKDAYELIEQEKPLTKQKFHPEMPKKPKSSYMLYYLDVKSHVLNENPGINAILLSKLIGEKFKNLSVKKRQKYNQRALQEKEEYKLKLSEFYNQHPEELKTVIEKERSKRADKENKFLRAKTPFALQKKQSVNNEVVNLTEYKENCLYKWKNLSDSRKFHFIRKAIKYQKELLNKTIELSSKSNQPVTGESVFNVLNKDEKNLILRLAGKPENPPRNGYTLFCKQKNSNDFCRIAIDWKELSDEDKKKFNKRAKKLQAVYKDKYENYIKNLPSDYKEIEFSLILNKRHDKKMEMKNTMYKNKYDCLDILSGRPAVLHENIVIDVVNNSQRIKKRKKEKTNLMNHANASKLNLNIDCKLKNAGSSNLLISSKDTSEFECDAQVKLSDLDNKHKDSPKGIDEDNHVFIQEEFPFYPNYSRVVETELPKKYMKDHNHSIEDNGKIAYEYHDNDAESDSTENIEDWVY